MSIGFEQTRTAAVLAAAAVLLIAATADAACRRPDGARLMQGFDASLAGASPTGVTLAPLAGSRQALRWAMVSWGPPPNGAVFVVDCAGRPVASKGLGAFDRVRAGPLIAGRPTLEALYQPPTGPNTRVQTVALLAWDAGRIEVLWKHESLSIKTTPLVPRDEASVWRWRYEPDGRTIRVTGHRTVGRILDMRAGRAKGLPRPYRPERFCWIPGRRRVDRC